MVKFFTTDKLRLRLTIIRLKTSPPNKDIYCMCMCMCMCMYLKLGNRYWPGALSNTTSWSALKYPAI